MKVASIYGPAQEDLVLVEDTIDRIKHVENFPALSKMLGHSNIKTTLIYRHVDRDEMRKGVNQVPVLRSEKIVSLPSKQISMHGGTPQTTSPEEEAQINQKINRH